MTEQDLRDELVTLLTDGPRDGRRRAVLSGPRRGHHKPAWSHRPAAYRPPFSFDNSQSGL